MVIAGILCGRIVFFQLICKAKKGFRYSASAEKTVFWAAERTFDISKEQVMLEAEQGISILRTRLIGNFPFFNLKPVQCGIHWKRNALIHQVLEECSITGSVHVYIFTWTVWLLKNSSVTRNHFRWQNQFSMTHFADKMMTLFSY